MRRVAGIAALLVTSACTIGPGARPTGPCPEVRPWTLSEQAELRREYDALKPDALLRAAFGDYLIMRDQARTCAAE